MRRSLLEDQSLKKERLIFALYWQWLPTGWSNIICHVTLSSKLSDLYLCLPQSWPAAEISCVSVSWYLFSEWPRVVIWPQVLPQPFPLQSSTWGASRCPSGAHSETPGSVRSPPRCRESSNVVEVARVLTELVTSGLSQKFVRAKSCSKEQCLQWSGEILHRV